MHGDASCFLIPSFAWSLKAVPKKHVNHEDFSVQSDVWSFSRDGIDRGWHDMVMALAADWELTSARLCDRARGQSFRFDA